MKNYSVRFCHSLAAALSIFVHPVAWAVCPVTEDLVKDRVIEEFALFQLLLSKGEQSALQFIPFERLAVWTNVLARELGETGNQVTAKQIVETSYNDKALQRMATTLAKIKTNRVVVEQISVAWNGCQVMLAVDSSMNDVKVRSYTFGYSTKGFDYKFVDAGGGLTIKRPEKMIKTMFPELDASFVFRKSYRLN